MTFSFFKTLLIFFFPLAALAQLTDEVLVQPAVNLSWNNGKSWTFNSSIAQRTEVQNTWNPLHIQAAQFASHEVGFYSQIGVGVMYRELFDETQSEELRFTEQWVHARKYNALKVAHRLRWDQRWRSNRLTHRWRYRLASSIPLNGAETNTSEYYLTGSAEAVFIAEAGFRPEWDQRFTVGLGKKLSTHLKLQFTTEYRFESYTSDTQKLLFLNLSMYYSL